MMRFDSMVRGLIGMAMLACYAAARAQDHVAAGGRQAEGITVFGTGELRAKPDMVEIVLRNAASAELTEDALVKYQDAKRRVIEAFAALKMDHLKIEERGLSLAPGNDPEVMQAMMRGMPVAMTSRMQVSIASTLRLQLTNVENVPADELMKTIGKILDVAQDAGAGIGPSQEELTMAYRRGWNTDQAPMVLFVLRDIGMLREQAYTKAMEDARSRAGRLAKLSGVRLGPVLAVQEIMVAGDDMSSSYPQHYPAYAQHYAANPSLSAALDDAPQITSPTFAEIPVRVKLLVRFSMEPAEAKTARN
jgi:uncharacterized protein YggE